MDNGEIVYKDYFNAAITVSYSCSRDLNRDCSCKPLDRLQGLFQRRHHREF